MTQVVSDHELFMKFEDLSSNFPYPPRTYQFHLWNSRYKVQDELIILMKFHWVCCNNVILHVMSIVQIFMLAIFFLSFSCWLIIMAWSLSLNPVSKLISSLQYTINHTLSLLLTFQANHPFWLTHGIPEFTSVVFLYITCLFLIHLSKLISRHKLRRLMICV